MTRPEFENLRDNGAFLEWAEFSNNLYATSFKSIENVLTAGKRCILDIDLQGVLSVKKCGQVFNPLFLFIKPPNFEDLQSRLVLRNTENLESLELRLNIAKEEMRFAEENPDFHDVIIVNDDCDVAYSLFEASILAPTKD